MKVTLTKISDLTITTGLKIVSGQVRMLSVIKFQVETTPNNVGEILNLQRPGLPIQITIDTMQPELPFAGREIPEDKKEILARVRHLTGSKRRNDRANDG